MEQKLRSYERLSPELAVLVETPNINNPSTLMTDYLVTGARGWDWLCQLHPKATIINLEDPSLNKVAADELVEFPSIVRAYDNGVGFYFVITPLGAESKAYMTTIEAKLKNPNVVVDELPWLPKEKHTLKLDIPADCEDPVGYANGVIKNFIASSNLPREQVDIEFRTISDAQRSQFYKDVCGDINVEDAYPKPGEPWPYARGCTPSTVIVDDAPYTNEGTENVADLSKAPKADIVIKDGDVVHYDGVKEYTPLIRKWAEDRNIIGGGSTTLDQFIKGLTEAGELWTHIGKGQRELLKDDIGDVYVCLVNAAGNLDINLEDHVRSLEAFQHHSGRAMYTNRGLKRYSLQVLYTLAAVAQSIDNILDSDNERDVEFFKTDFSDACADVVYVLETIALEQGWSLTDCVIAAYEDIRDRKGLMVDGCFVKEKDFTDEMVSAALADDRVKPETKDYLRQWVLQQLSDQSQEMEAHDLRAESVAKVDQPEPVSGVASAPAPTPAVTEVKTPFWRVWNDAQGNKANIAPFTISGEVAHLLNDQKDDQIVVTLGIFGQPNHNGEVFVIDDNVLRARLDAMVGKQVGEINNPELQEGESLESWFKRVEALDPANTAGTLLGYAVTTLGAGEHGSIIEVVGLVEPSAFTKDRVATAGNAYFGIRGVVTQRMRYGTRVNHVEKLAGFDLSIENPRELK